MDAKHKPSILFVYFTYTKQTLKVVEAMSEVLQRRGCDVHRAVIEFEDPRYAKRFERPFRLPPLIEGRRLRNAGATSGALCEGHATTEPYGVRNGLKSPCWYEDSESGASDARTAISLQPPGVTHDGVHRDASLHLDA